MKKKLLIIAVLILTLSNIYALDMSGLIGESNYFDSALIAMLLEFYTYRIMFIKIAKLIAVSVAVIGAFWWVMKIILLGENVEKAIINIVTRFILYVLLTMFYFDIVDGGLSLACQLGLGRSLSKMSEKLTQMTIQIEEQLNNAQAVLKNSIELGYKYTGITEKEIKKLAKRTKMTQSDLEKYLEKNDVQIYSGWGFFQIRKNKVSSYREMVMSNYQKAENDYKSAEKKVTGGASGNLPPQKLTKAEEDAIQKWTSYSNKAEKAKQDAIDAFTKQVGDEGITFDDAVTRLDAITKTFMTPAEAEKLWSDANEAWKNLQPVNVSSLIKVNPFISDGHGGFILSPSMILKVGIFVATISNSQTASSINTIDLSEKTPVVNSTGLGVSQQSDNSGSGGSVIQKAKTKLQNFTYKHIFSLIIDLIINLGIIACCIYFCIQYCMMLLEYYLVFAIGFLLLPFIVLEPLANYTKNLLKLLISYFFKGMVMCICLGFAWSQFLELSEILTRPGVGGTMVWTDPWTLLVTVFFTLTICLAFVGEAPKIAQTLLSGNPDMSMGEFMKQAMAVAGGVKIGGKIAKKAGATAAKGAGGLVKGGIAAKMASDAHAQKKNELAPAKQAKDQAAEGLKTAKTEQKAAGESLASARKEQVAAQGNFATAQSRVDESQRNYDAAQKAAEGKGADSKEQHALREAATRLQTDKKARDTAQKELIEKNDNVKAAETKKQAADEKVKKAAQQKKAYDAHYSVAKRTPGARNAVGALFADSVDNSKLVRYAMGGNSVSEFKTKKQQTVGSARDKKQNEIGIPEPV